MNGIRKCIFSFLFIASSLLGLAQQDAEDMLNEKVVVENPVYKPVVALGSGVLNFYGDVQNNFNNLVIGDFGYKLNISAFVDPKRYFNINFFLIYGKLSADQRSSIPDQNLNFQSDLTDFGVNLEYGFGHIFKKSNTIRPFISVGLANLQFTPKGDSSYFDSEAGRDLFYNYWTDGSIRNIAQTVPNNSQAKVMSRDYDFETDLRLSNTEKYSRNAFSVPVDMGLDFRISDRVTCRLGTSLHLTTTDFLDNVKKGGKDFFTYNYFSFRLDLFSQPKTMIVEKMFAEMEIDDVMFDDEDGDYILDPVDQCPATPYGIIVDSTGCPLDEDNDGVPDYLDMEPETYPGVWVDASGKAISEDAYLAHLLQRSEAMGRTEVRAYFETIGKGYVRKLVTEIPEKFRKLDIDGDGYIAFEELLKAIDDYFDNKYDFKVEDIYELNNFFFEQ